jgi:mRNA turnover protein 4
MFGVVTSEFKIALKAHWTRSTSEVEILEKDENGMEVE